MIVETLIPFFLAVHLPIEDGAWQYGPEYIFSVHTNTIGEPRCSHDVTTCDPIGYNISSRLHCIPKENDKLSCSIRDAHSSSFGTYYQENIRNRWNISDEPIELLFNEKGIESIITQPLRPTYHLNILKMVIEQLHTGDDYNDIDHGTFSRVTESIIGTCNVTFEVYHRPNSQSHRSFRLQLLPQGLRMTSGEKIVIDKTTNLNNCSCYASGLFRKIGDTVVTDYVTADLESTTSRMEISDESFISSTTKKGIMTRDNKIYDMTDTTQVILEDIQPAMRSAPVIENPFYSKILANY